MDEWNCKLDFSVSLEKLEFSPYWEKAASCLKLSYIKREEIFQFCCLAVAVIFLKLLFYVRAQQVHQLEVSRKQTAWRSPALQLPGEIPRVETCLHLPLWDCHNFREISVSTVNWGKGVFPWLGLTWAVVLSLHWALLLLVEQLTGFAVYFIHWQQVMKINWVEVKICCRRHSRPTAR